MEITAKLHLLPFEVFLKFLIETRLSRRTADVKVDYVFNINYVANQSLICGEIRVSSIVFNNIVSQPTEKAHMVNTTSQKNDNIFLNKLLDFQEDALNIFQIKVFYLVVLLSC